MILSAEKDGIFDSMLVDEATGQRIPFCFWLDTETGRYKAYKPTADGKRMVAGPGWKPVVVEGRTKGKPKLMSLDQAWRPKPEKPPTVDKQAGLEVHKRLFTLVHQARGDSRRVIDDRWLDEIKGADMFDEWVVRK